VSSCRMAHSAPFLRPVRGYPGMPARNYP
jgi:hypothetical protein